MRLLALLLVLCLASGPGWAQAGASGEPRPPALILADLINLQKKREQELAALRLAFEKSEASLKISQESLTALAKSTDSLVTFSQSLASALTDSRQESETWKLFSVAGLSAGAVGLALAGLALWLR